MILLAFTTSYPYDLFEEQVFHDGEMKVFSRQFERVIYVPRHARGNRLPTAANVEVDASFSNSLALGRRLFAGFLSLFSKDFYQDIKSHFPASLSLSYLRKLFSFLSGARLTRIWVEDWIKRQNISDKNALFYTFWFDETTMGIGLAKKKYSGLRLISRAHGYDLYEEIYGAWPCRYQAISMLDGLFADSSAGEKYLREKYSDFSEKYGTALLGAPDPGAVSKPSQDGILRVISCSMLTTVKRVDLLFDGLVAAARMRGEQKIEWRHFGDGSVGNGAFGDGASRESYIEKAASEFPENLKGHFPGYSNRADLLQNYLNNPVDIFVNVSKTEGTSVSIMEAASCGIPILATAVGGNVEIVSKKNGFLLKPNPTPEEIAEALLNIADNPELTLAKRQGSRAVWNDQYNETKNFERFAERLKGIRSN